MNIKYTRLALALVLCASSSSYAMQEWMKNKERAALGVLSGATLFLGGVTFYLWNKVNKLTQVSQVVGSHQLGVNAKAAHQELLNDHEERLDALEAACANNSISHNDSSLQAVIRDYGQALNDQKEQLAKITATQTNHASRIKQLFEEHDGLAAMVTASHDRVYYKKATKKGETGINMWRADEEDKYKSASEKFAELIKNRPSSL